MQDAEDIRAWAECQKDDQFSTADDKRRKKLTSLIREFSTRLPQGYGCEWVQNG
tara:strand:+ start:221 stop:382 length:162 start_codon:yes stop_codon:yes gene_type:complete